MASVRDTDSQEKSFGKNNYETYGYWSEVEDIFL